MKRLNLIIGLGILTATTGVFAQQPTPAQQQQLLQMAQEGCHKPIGHFPTPSKLVCILTTFGISREEAKPKAMALIFNVCHGRLLQPAPAGVTPKAYPTLATCLSDPNAITLINKELTAQGFTEVKVTNSTILTAPKVTAPANTQIPAKTQ